MNQAAIALLVVSAVAQKSATDFQKKFDISKTDLVSTGRNDYFILEPGFKLELAHGDVRLIVSVLNETKVVDGAETRVVEERESKAGHLVEISRNYFAIHKSTKDVYYFGEDVDIYKGGKVVSHESAWQSGKDGAQFGLMMPAKPKIGQAYYQELAPKVAMDRVRIVGFVPFKTPAGKFEKALKVEETTPLEPGVKEYKYYAPGIGLIFDSDLVLVKKP